MLSAVVVRKHNDLETVKLVDRVRERLQKPREKVLHFRDLKHEQRLPLVEEIARAPLRTVNVLVYKPSLLEPEKFQERYRLYFYAVRYLLERVSWLCRDRHQPGSGDGRAEVVFSNRSGMSYEELKGYMRLLQERSLSSDIRIDWSVIDCEQMKAFSPGKRMGLQIADAVASSFFKAVEPSIYGHTETRYAEMLRPVVYRHSSGMYRGHGLKLWPREVEARIGSEAGFRWLREVYRW